MERYLLVAYTSEFGSTQQVAEMIGAGLHDSKTMVDVRTVYDITRVDPYHGVVVGSPIYNGAWLPEATDFVSLHAAALARMPVAYFAVSMTMRRDTPYNRRVMLSYLEAVRAAAPDVHPVDIGLFAGALNYRNLPLLERLRFRLAARLPGGDYRNWSAVAEWTARLRAVLATAATT